MLTDPKGKEHEMGYKTFEGYNRGLNRIDLHSELLLKRIVEDLDPNNFTLDEIVEEGFAGTVEDEYVSEKARKKIMRGILQKLIDKEKVELIEEGGDSYRVAHLVIITEL